MSAYTPNEFIALYFKGKPAGEAELERIAEGLAQHTSYRVWERWLSPRKRIAILNVSTWPLSAEAARESGSAQRMVETNRLRVRERMTLLQTGYTTSDQAVWEASLQRIGGTLRCADAGGIAAFCLALLDPSGEERLFLWNTRPGLRAIASAENSDVWIASTRPRLAHLLARDFRDTSLSRNYVLASLPGWSLDDATPFEGTSLLPVDGLWRVEGDGVASLAAHPTEPYQRSSLSLLMMETRRYRDALREAVAPLGQVPGFELRLSGGKDSRLVASALYERGIVPSTALCHAIPGEWESPVAERVASALGWSIKYAVPEFSFRGDLLSSVRHNLSLSDGFFLSEPLQVPYPQYGVSGDQGPGLVLGHIELQRGGWAKSMRGGPVALRRQLMNHLAPRRQALQPEFVTRVGEYLDATVARLKPSSRPETAYQINYHFRVCRWLTSQLLLHCRVLLPMYPLLDEKVVRVVSNAPLSMLVSETLAFSATCENAPQLRTLGLFKDRYRFEKKRRSLRFMRGYRERAPIEPGPSTYFKREILRPGGVARALCDHIRQGKLRDELREASLAPVWAAIEDPSEERMQASGVSRKMLSSYLWTCYQASILFTDGLTD